MKRAHTLLAFALALPLSACEPVTSLHALYTKEDLVLEPKLLGEWEGYGDNGQQECTWSFEQAGEDAYTLTIRDNKEETVAYDIHLVRLRGHLFMDAYPRVPREILESFAPHVWPMHTIHRIWVDDNTVRVAWLDDDRFKRLVEEKRPEIAHEREENSVILTASTHDLQQFATQYIEQLFDAEEPLIVYRKDNDAFLSSLTQKTEAAPDDPDALEAVATFHLNHGEYAEAVKAYQKVVSVDPQSPWRHRQLGLVLALMGRYDQAHREFQETLLLNPKDEWAHFNNGFASFQQRRYEEAVQAFERYRRMTAHPGAIETLWHALALRHAGKHAEADALLEDLAQKQNYSGWEKDLLDYHRGKLSEEKLISRAASRDALAAALFFAGSQHFLCGDTLKARELFQQAVETQAYGKLEYAAAKARL